MHRLEVISSQKLWTLEGIDSALDCASKRKETEVSAFLMNEQIWWIIRQEVNV